MDLKEFIYFNKKKIVVFIVGFIIVGLSFLGYFYYSNYYNKDDKNVKNLSEENKLILTKEENEEEIIEMCFFDIKGEVNNPGVYSIECDKRLIDAINASGGLTKNSDTSVLNLSKKIEDGMVIVVYSKKEVDNYLETLKKEEKKASICTSFNIENNGCNNNNSNNSNSNNNLININTASLSELMTLTGIGESKAKNIISYRETTPFKSIEDILNVEGIGESIYVNIKENITV